jgi:prepilin-type N-terminal cleavage/methylation domain-containing protein
MSKRLNRGFTLIELLVVIAIIGILSSVVLASLNTARSKGADAAVKSNLNNIRAQAELVYDTNSSYAAVCADTNVTRGVAAAASAAGVAVATVDAIGTGVAVCQDSTTAWAAQSPLKSSATTYFCVDNTGYASTTTTTLGATDYICN